MQSIDVSCGIQIDGFSARTEPPGPIFEDFDDLGVFACVVGFLTLPPRGLMTARECHRVSKACPECFSEFIHPGYSKPGLKGFHLAPFGSTFVVLGFLSFGPKPFRGAKLAVEW